MASCQHWIEGDDTRSYCGSYMGLVLGGKHRPHEVYNRACTQCEVCKGTLACAPFLLHPFRFSQASDKYLCKVYIAGSCKLATDAPLTC